MRGPRKFFTEDEDWDIIRRRANDETPAEIGRARERNGASIIARLQRYDANTVRGAKAVLASGVLERPSRASDVNQVNGPTLAPSQIEERDRRYKALSDRDRDLTAYLCGDPPRGYSALDLRQRAES